jgi:hypothetical protein
MTALDDIAAREELAGLTARAELAMRIEKARIAEQGGPDMPGATDFQAMLDKVNDLVDQAMPVVEGAWENIRNEIFEIDPSVSSAGVPDFGVRARLSRGDIMQEREQGLAENLGAGGYGKDVYGAYVATPSGMEHLGLPATDRPVRIDEPWLTRHDFADISGDAPAMASSLGALALAPFTGGGSLAAMLLAGGGSMLGKTLGETGEYMAGENLQTLPEVATDVGMEGIYGGAGEGVMRYALQPLGRKAMAPHAKSMTPEKTALAQEAVDIGGRASPSQITSAPILGRFEGMMNQIFGDRLAEKNSRALNAEMDRLRNVTYPTNVSASEVGAAIKSDISTARTAVSTWAKATTARLDELTGGTAVVPTARLKEVAAEILDRLPKDQRTGKPLFSSAETQSAVDDILGGLPDHITFSEMTETVGRLWKAVDSDTIIPGVASHDAKQLWLAAREGFEGATAPAGTNAKVVQDAIASFRTTYKDRIDMFDNALVSRIMRDKKFASALEPEQIVNATFSKGTTAPLKRVMALLDGTTVEKVRRLAMDDILGAISSRTDDPLIDIFQGKAFLNNLDKYGKPTLEAMFGKKTTQELYRLGRVTSLTTTRRGMSGGLVAANIALHPLRNVTKLLRFRILSKIMTSPNGVKWLTVGLDAPKTRAGANALARVAVMAQSLLNEHTRETEQQAPTRDLQGLLTQP